jgi:metal-dependent amidase/aminoacylase/carboxypeptidase family protein
MVLFIDLLHNVSSFVLFLFDNDNHAGIITKGGSVPNVIPHETELFYNIRAPTVVELHELIQKIKACFEAAALATGCKVCAF